MPKPLAPVHLWPKPPADTAPALWRLFLSCGTLVGMAVEGHHIWGQDLVVDSEAILSAAQRRFGTSATLPAMLPRAGDRRHIPRMSEERQCQEISVRMAIRLLSESPEVTFPFLPRNIPPVVALILAILAGRYISEEGFRPLKLRRTFSLLNPEISCWEAYGKALSAYCQKKSAWLGFHMPDNAVSALDGIVTLSRSGFNHLFSVRAQSLPSAEDEDFDLFGYRGRRHAGLDYRVIQLVEPSHDLSNLVLPPDTKSELKFAAQVILQGTTDAPVLLFHGSTGTGKTHASYALAGSTGKNLAIAPIPNLISKYIGDTEKMLDSAFKEAERAGAILLLDEADALLYSRDMAIRSWELSHVNTLLKLLERPSTPVIIATNYFSKLDEALLRRVTHLVEFRCPDFEQRKAIWELELRKSDIPDCTDLDAVASVPLTGGLIANAVARLARKKALLGNDYRVTTDTLMAAAKGEIPKMGRAGAEGMKIGFSG